MLMIEYYDNYILVTYI